MSKEQRHKEKGDDKMMTVMAASNSNKQVLLDELRDSLLELKGKRKSGCTKSTGQSSWRDLFDDEDDE